MVVLKQLGAEPELVHCHATLTLEALMTSAVTLVGVRGAGVGMVLQTTVIVELYYCLVISTGANFLGR